MGRAPNLPVDLSDLTLSHREMRFIGILCTTGDPVKATRDCEYVDRDASDVEAHLASIELRNKPDIQAGIQRYREYEFAPYRDYFQMKLLRFLDSRAFFNIRDFVHDDGSVKDLDEIPAHLLQAIDGITEDFKGKEADVRTVKFSLPNRMEAVKMLRELLKETAPSKAESTGLTNEHMDFLSSVFNRLDAEVVGKAAGAAALAGYDAGKKAKATEDSAVAEAKNTVQHAPVVPMIEDVPALDPMARLEQELQERETQSEPTRRRHIADGL